MKSKQLFSVFIWGIYALVNLLFNAHIFSEHQDKSHKYQLSISTIFKDDADFLKEWIEYHQLVGVEHFYLYDNDSTDHFRDILDPYIEKGVVTLTHWPDRTPDASLYSWVFRTQVSAMEHAIKLSEKDTKWLAIIDSDEYLVPNKCSTLPEILEKYSNAPGVTFTWLLFGTSNVQKLNENTLLIEALTRCSEPQDSINNDVVKTIVKPTCFLNFSWAPHRCNFKDNAQAIDLNKSEGQINHYINRTVDYFLNYKVKKREKTENRKLTQNEIDTWKNKGNDTEDKEETIRRFIPLLKKRMNINV